MSQPLLLAIIIILMIAYFYNLHYRAKKQVQYKNDERWREIELLSSRIGYKFFQYLVILIAIGMVYLTFIPSVNIDISLSRTLFLGFAVIILGQLVEMVALKVFDHRM
ncbi:hypothetical protein FC83_GL000232 [Agrilactobacillus composti DSM 18527 = JCM 14202]|uniref:Uncharacterized protein n=1 Tax=Agrilactobacillus composti DSM 18527 = JCM 14202 TaxID=1423734 RepID=X0PRZ5_9LACO|nr:hypothetical protein [Agrilactobacillus composti]KRM32830.1 hypothetical protein FC83_GL000232 [Agrilactobacillus composti DSM 18527 = JCM 14202]GAF40637.1 hypothetical protein JCM14202_2543 [Agrilactobacillus composti DSM 18527 = JCM 14202]